MDRPLRAIGYTRLSLDERFHTGAGMDAQRTAIQAECRYRGWQLLEVVEDLGYTGGNLNRPGIKGALARLDAHQADCLIVAKLDRLSRSLVDFVDLTERSRRGRWGLIALDLQVDTTTPAGEAMANVLATFAQFERRRIAQRIREAKALQRSQGRVYGVIPFGFRRVGDRLAADKREQRVLDRVRRMYADGTTYTAIAAHLNERGIRGKNGGRWKGAQVKYVLHLNDVIGRPLHELAPPKPYVPVHPVPFGYRAGGGALVEDRAEQAAIASMRRMYKHGLSPQRIARQLELAHVPTKRGGRWTAQTVRNCLLGVGAVRARERDRAGTPAPTLDPALRMLPRSPYGYRISPTGLTKDPDEQRVIARVTSLHASGVSINEITRRLRAGAPTRRGRAWGRQAVTAILRQAEGSA